MALTLHTLAACGGALLLSEQLSCHLQNRNCLVIQTAHVILVVNQTAHV